MKFRAIKKGAGTLRNWVLAAALLPTVWATAKAGVLMLPVLGREGWQAWGWYAAGAGAYLIVDFLVHRPMWMYVVGHEMTHVVSGLLSGAKVHSFEATSKGGEVKLSKSNAFIALSPYIVPIYSVAVILLYAGLKKWWPLPHMGTAFQFLLGGTIAFHLALTYHAVHTRQPDLKILGLFLSTVLILLGNLLILGFLGISLFKTTPTVKQYFSTVGNDTVLIWKKGIKHTENLWIH